MKQRKRPDVWIYRIDTEGSEVKIDRRLATWTGIGLYRAPGFGAGVSPEDIAEMSDLRKMLVRAREGTLRSIEHSKRVATRNTEDHQRIYNALKASPLADDAFELAQRFDHRESDAAEVRDGETALATIDALLAAPPAPALLAACEAARVYLRDKCRCVAYGGGCGACVLDHDLATAIKEAKETR